jgi:hypothetical protein
MLSESGIIGQALLVIVRIQTDLSRKAGLSSVFLIRVVYVMDDPPYKHSTDNRLDRSVIVAIICQLAYASHTSSSTDFTFDTWTIAVSTQMAQGLSIVTACSPQFKPFLDNLRSSGMGLGMSSSDGYGSKHKTYGVSTFKSRRTQDTRSDTHELVSLPREETHRTIVTSAPDDDAESQSSHSNIIMETRTWTVTQGLRD